MKCFGFKHSNIYVFGKGIEKTSLCIDNGKIKEIGNDLKNKEFIELDDKYIVLPGFIDKHTHGANSADFMNPSKEKIKLILSAIAKEGTTSCLATTMTQSKENIILSLQTIASYIEEKPAGVEILGVHLEGPFISPKHAGAQPLKYIIPCDIRTFDELNKKAMNHIKQVTLAVEENGLDLVKHLKSKGIVASLGHTDCSYEEAIEAVNQGATSTSHMFNAMHGLHHRNAGTVGAGLLSDELNCELICDMIHVSKPVVQLLYKNKGKDGICLITDAMEAKWMPDGDYQLGGQKVIVKNGEARLEDGTLAGSTLKMNEAIHNFIKATGVTLIDAVDLATINPARCLHVEDKKGSIEVGKDADFVVVDKDLNVYMTICRGEIVYSKF
ncbi:MAG: N-acetylglucosamine-6-phosphate deacetylase [Anaeroplasmataceae bacterium]|nr:N-acetylglucosamine-6-phosphate deacetylase [Anaeroplasmataceae bacterium]MDE6415255.1 N-acetylglucosamine-6-phosphate deacetylase [Anaeroplasmataceae bacterium]